MPGVSAFQSVEVTGSIPVLPTMKINVLRIIDVSPFSLTAAVLLPLEVPFAQLRRLQRYEMPTGRTLLFLNVILLHRVARRLKDCEKYIDFSFFSGHIGNTSSPLLQLTLPGGHA
jgi:hypothetical protein